MEEIKALQRIRSRRAAFRAEGLELLTDLLAQSTAPSTQAELLGAFMRALREVRVLVGRGDTCGGCLI